MIISASRRTDIPAFYHQWFMNRVRAGFLLIRNPYNTNQVKRVSLLPQDIDAFVFWTRNPEPFIKHLPELDELGYKYYFQYTITGYPKSIERHVPHPQRSIDTFIRLSELIGKNKVIWRYDPILLCNILPVDEHKRLFTKIAEKIHKHTERVVLSFADLYKKTESNLNKIENFNYSDILTNKSALDELMSHIQATCNALGIKASSCAEEINLSKYGISHGKCIDDSLLKELLNIPVNATKDSGQREACGCIKSIDIGQYNTCLHGCSYCYATFNNEAVLKNRKKHDPTSPLLIGDASCVDKNLLLPPIIQHSLF